MYYIYNISQNTYNIFSKYCDVLHFMYTHNITCDDINMNYYDTKREEVTGNGEYNVIQYVVRNYMVFDSDFKIFDVRDDLLQYQPPDKIFKRTSRYYFRFRKDPVPHTRKRLKYIVFLRTPKTFNEKRQNCDREYKRFIRGKRHPTNLPSLYDDIVRLYSKSWKDCTKKKHQWE